MASVCLGSLISPINIDFNGVFENYYWSTCRSLFGDLILRPGNSQKRFYFQNSLIDLQQSHIFSGRSHGLKKTPSLLASEMFPPVSNDNQRIASP